MSMWKSCSHHFLASQGTDDLKDLSNLKRVVYDIVIYPGCENTHFQGSNFVSQANGNYVIS